jgi:hypothetical protein
MLIAIPKSPTAILYLGTNGRTAEYVQPTFKHHVDSKFIRIADDSNDPWETGHFYIIENATELEEIIYSSGS